MFGASREEEPETPEVPKLSPAQALSYWRDAARALKGILNQIDATTPETEHMDGMVEEMRDAATQHLVAANALVGHYTMLASDQTGTFVPTSPAPIQQTQPHSQGQSFVPSSRQAAMPGVTFRQQPAGVW